MFVDFLLFLFHKVCCCCCQCGRNIGETENGVENSGGNKSTNGQWDIYLDSQYDTLTGSLIIASEESETNVEYIYRALLIFSISSKIYSIVFDLFVRFEYLVPIILIETILVLVFCLMFIFGSYETLEFSFGISSCSFSSQDLNIPMIVRFNHCLLCII